MTEQKSYTTGQVALFCGVTARTVIRWIQRGNLIGYQLPGRGDRRVTHTDLLAFLSQHDIPIPAALRDSQKKRVLIVDDDEEMANTIARILKRAHYSTQTAHTGFDAGRLLQTEQPHIMTLDLAMPGMNGLSVIQSIQQHSLTQKPYILVISGQDDSQHQKALRYGADATLAKPFGKDALLAAVERGAFSQ